MTGRHRRLPALAEARAQEMPWGEPGAEVEPFRDAFQHAPTGLALCTSHGDIHVANEALAGLLGCSVPELTGTSVFELTHDGDLRVAHRAIARMRGAGAHRIRETLRLRRADGQFLHVVFAAARVDDQNGAIRGLIVAIDDVTHRVELEAALQHQALHDPLTGLPNRALFVQRLNDAAADGGQGRGSPLAVLFMDLDRFKVINDNHGHAAGDAVLVAVAGRLKTLLRPGDTAARFGGDEFVLLCQGVGAEGATRIAQRVSTALDAEIAVGEQLRLPVTASIGIAVRGEPRDPPEWLIREADMAMYRAKAAGRARIEPAPRP